MVSDHFSDYEAVSWNPSTQKIVKVSASVPSLNKQGVGERFSGNVFLGSVTYLIENNEWITEVGMGMSPESITSELDAVAPAAAGFLPGGDWFF